jgi:halimadienyl-diphosphate synthase
MPDSPLRLPSREELIARTRVLLTKANLDDMQHSEYDAAWLARVPKPGAPQEPAFPEVLKVIRETQAADGGWGAPEVEYTSARLLATLASILALTDFDGFQARAQAEEGARFVRERWERIRKEPDLTIGFELVAATLVKEACARGFKLESLLEDTEKLQREKLAKVPPQMLYAPTLSLGFSLEFLGDGLDVEKARGLQLANGSIGASVAATAYFVRRSGDPVAYRHLQELVAAHGARAIPFGTPAQLWATIWLLFHVHMSGFFPELRTELEPHFDFILKNIKSYGLAWSSAVSYGDSDDSSVGFMVLHEGGYSVDWSPLVQYERPNGFVGFLAERGPSVTANAHVLDAIQGRPYPGGAASVEKAARFVLAQRLPEGYWTDKWHASPYYATSCSVRALLHWDATCVRPSLEWLAKQQRDNGSWGWFKDGTPEETAYALHALAAGHAAGLPVEPSVLARGLDFLYRYDGTEPTEEHPRMWISKGLYSSPSVVRSAVIAAQVLCAQVLGAWSRKKTPALAASAR